MVFDLLGQDGVSPAVEPHVFDDVRLTSFLESFFSHAEAAQIINVWAMPQSAQGISDRQGLYRALEDADVRQYFDTLLQAIANLTVDRCVLGQANEPRCRQARFFKLAQSYTELIKTACDETLYNHTDSVLLRRFMDLFFGMMRSETFRTAAEDTSRLSELFEEMGITQIRIQTSQAIPSRCALTQGEEGTLTMELYEIAKHFNADARLQESTSMDMSPSFIDALAALHPDLFAQLNAFHDNYQLFFTFDIFSCPAQLTYCLNIYRLFEELKQRGVSLCLPEIAQNKQLKVSAARDITLLPDIKGAIVPNDIDLNENEGFCILTGANGGGKTTYLRTMGLCQILFSAGLPVPAEQACLFPFSGIFTHFPADERFDRVGRLKDEQMRVDIITNAASGALVLLNETYSSTSEEVAVDLSLKLLENLCRKENFGLFITHQYRVPEQAGQISAGTKIGYLEAIVLSDEGNTRTFKIMKKKTDKQSHAYDILNQYGLTKEKLTAKLLEAVI